MGNMVRNPQMAPDKVREGLDESKLTPEALQVYRQVQKTPWPKWPTIKVRSRLTEREIYQHSGYTDEKIAAYDRVYGNLDTYRVIGYGWSHGLGREQTPESYLNFNAERIFKLGELVVTE